MFGKLTFKEVVGTLGPYLVVLIVVLALFMGFQMLINPLALGARAQAGDLQAKEQALEIKAKNDELDLKMRELGLKAQANKLKAEETQPAETLLMELGDCSASLEAVFQQPELDLASNKRYLANGGCGLIKVDGVAKLEGKEYIFQEHSTDMSCGSAGMNDGVPRSPEECVAFLNAHKGQTLRVFTIGRLVIYTKQKERS